VDHRTRRAFTGLWPASLCLRSRSKGGRVCCGNVPTLALPSAAKLGNSHGLVELADGVRLRRPSKRPPVRGG
jgi:hypothetical protein